MDKNLQNNFNLAKATENILQLKKDMGKSIISIGKWLILVKENLPRGEWMNWLKYEVHIPYVQAWRFIKISQEVDYATLEKVGYRKMSEILELPPSKFREELIEMAPALRREDIHNIMQDPEQNLANYPHGDNTDAAIEAAMPPTADADAILDGNATLLDGLQRIQLSEMSKDYIDLLRTQLEVTPAKLQAFLEELRKV